MSLRSKEQLIDIYGEENVREHMGRLQVQEEHFQNPGGRVLEWVEADQALPPSDPSDEPILEGQFELPPIEELIPEDEEEDEEEESEAE